MEAKDDIDTSVRYLRLKRLSVAVWGTGFGFGEGGERTRAVLVRLVAGFGGVGYVHSYYQRAEGSDYPRKRKTCTSHRCVIMCEFFIYFYLKKALYT